MISYGRADKKRVRRLAALLKSRGYTVWWDADLEYGEAYRARILKEIAVARTVVVIWSFTSINSDWVRAEAERAKAGNKLLPTKVKALPASDIPIPFSELNTPDIENLAALADQIQKNLLKPQVGAHWLTRLNELTRYQLLAFWGILSGVLTVICSVAGLFELSTPLSWVVKNWTEALRLFWRVLFLLQVRLGPFDAIFLTILALITANIFASVARDASSERSKHTKIWQRVSLCLSIAVLLWVSGIGVEAGVGKYLERSERTAVIALKALFPTDPRCASIATGVVEGLRDDAYNLTPDLSSRLELHRSVHACAAEHGMPEYQLMQKIDGIAQRLYENGRDHVLKTLGYGPAFALQVLLPFLLYSISRLFTHHRLNVGQLARRLWLTLACVASVILLNSGLLALERLDWRALLDQP